MQAFTLIELLVVVVVISILLAVLLPVLFAARRQGLQASCISNLHQIGAAIQMYSEDSDGQFPYGADACDLNTDGWFDTLYADDVSEMLPLPDIMRPYESNITIWHCPADVGFKACGLASSAMPLRLDAAPSEFDAYGTSYSYNTLLALQDMNMSTVVAYDPRNPNKQYGSSNIILLGDSVGTWHGGTAPGEQRYNILFVDDHAAEIDENREQYLWSLQVVAR